MYDIYAMSFEYEECARDKGNIDMVFPYAVFHFVLSGAGYVNDRRITGGSVFISFEENRMSYRPDREDPWSYIYFRVGGRDVREAFLDCDFSLGLTVLPFTDTEALQSLYTFYQHRRAEDDPRLLSVIANAVFLLFPTRSQGLPKGSSRARAHADRVRRYIDENYYRKITVDAIAAKFYLNKNYLCTLFVRYFGLSPKQYLQRARMQRASYLLTRTEESVSLIALSVGYEDVLLFSKMFKKHYGLSPREYRLKNKETE